MSSSIGKMVFTNVMYSGFRNRARNFCYKTVKRSSVFKEKKTVNLSIKNAENVSLAGQIQAKIRATGPITVAEYMKEVLTNPVCGYYMKKDVFGHRGDFITSPEIGQIFGELVAIWCLTQWQKVGSPSPLQVVELGPGRGTLVKDLLRVFSHFHIKADQLSFHLVEVSPFLSQVQAQRLCYKHTEVNPEEQNVGYYKTGETASGVKLFWYQRLDDVPKDFSIIVAHEFFDALPIHKLQKIDGIWKEVLVDIDPKSSENFRLVISRAQTPVSKIFQPVEDENRQLLEYSLETENVLNKMVERFDSDGGIGLIMDYGHFGDKTDTFRAFKNHKLHDPFKDLGAADLTADVDFKYLKWFAERDSKVISFGPVEQKDFIEKMEGEARLKVLLENALPEDHETIKSGYKMLTDANQMGSRFKFFSMFPSVLKDHLKKFPVEGF